MIDVLLLDQLSARVRNPPSAGEKDTMFSFVTPKLVKVAVAIQSPKKASF